MLGHDAVSAGFALAALTLGWPLAASNAGRLYLTIGFRATTMIGAVIALGGALLLLNIDADSSLLMVAFEGVGVGLLVPLLSLLLGGSNAVPMRPIQWLQLHLPHHSPAFYVGVCCCAIVAAIGLKNAASRAPVSLLRAPIALIAASDRS